MEDWLKCQIIALVKYMYRQNQTKTNLWSMLCFRVVYSIDTFVDYKSIILNGKRKQINVNTR